MNYPSPALVELGGHIGYDWVFIDAEHGALDLETCEHMVRAAETAGIIPIIRLPYAEPDLVNRYLDTGAMGILVPHLASASQARAMVRAAKYHPTGGRGAGSRTRAADYGFRRSATDYASWANDETFVMGIVEDRAAIEELPEILRTPGIDGIVVGPSDLSQSFGVPGQLTHPSVVAAVDEISRQVLASSKALCRVLTNTATAKDDLARFLAMGAPMIAEPFTGLFFRGARAILDVRDAGRNRTT
ncbi:MAG TPA: aldolase/citrate lyase family protein [Candidatus Limnocylindrales bacterium]|nr:aldolase/citrate lyase family protein [Candidatus Limnocylindrales bacterium]